MNSKKQKLKKNISMSRVTLKQIKVLKRVKTFHLTAERLPIINPKEALKTISQKTYLITKKMNQITAKMMTNMAAKVKDFLSLKPSFKRSLT
jgi:hypothetical protein